MTHRDDRPGSFLGTGWGFPPSFSPGGAAVRLVSEAEDIHESLQILLGTRIGERVMHEGYGCELQDGLFEELDQALVGQIESWVRNAVLYHEPRIALEALEVTEAGADGLLSIRLEYSILGTNSRYNMVFPFYLNEAVAPER